MKIPDDGHPLGVNRLSKVARRTATDEKDGNEYCPSTIVVYVMTYNIYIYIYK